MVVVCLMAAAGSVTTTDQGNRFVQTILVANKASFHPQMVNPDMINPWGIAVRPPGAGGHFWINNAGTGTSVEYIGDVNGVALFQDGLKSVTLDAPRFTDHGVPTVTGLAYNAASDIPGQPIEFPVSGPAGNYSTTPSTPVPGGTSGSAKFVFVTEDGAINAWRLNTATAMTSAPLVIGYSKTARFPYTANCVFSGVAMTVNPSTSAAFAAAGGNRLFATDFRNNAIDVFSNQWKDVTSSFHFQTPSSVGALHPFNIAALDGHLYVASFVTSTPESSTRRGGWRSRRRASADSAAPCWSPIWATARLPRSIGTPAASSTTCAMRPARPSASSASGGSSLATASASATPTRSILGQRVLEVVLGGRVARSGAFGLVRPDDDHAVVLVGL